MSPDGKATFRVQLLILFLAVVLGTLHLLAGDWLYPYVASFR